MRTPLEFPGEGVGFAPHDTGADANLLAPEKYESTLLNGSPVHSECACLSYSHLSVSLLSRYQAGG